ncbi:MAG: hypothetical protein FWG56_09395 [Desulfovibrionaceae bacterium]|nr:hypothetical protein [Desulfovibrionaceae bacterium]
MENLELSHVQIANLNMLILVAECAKQNNAIACSRFGLDAKQTEFLASLAFQEMLTRIAHLGDECLFPPRSDLTQVLTWPPPLASALLMVHPPAPANSPRPARGNTGLPSSPLKP